jgi:predicted transglutaminase-like cysteine proteinase
MMAGLGQMRLLGGVLTGLFGLGLIASVGAQASNPTRVIPAAVSPTPVLEDVKPPIGWIDFCPTHAEDCDGPVLPAKKISLNAATWGVLVRVNQQVNSDIEQVEDMALYGVSEKWTYPDAGKGDCEDIALLKRRILMREGMPRQALLMTVVRDETGAGHAILTVVTDRGDFVLDSKTSRVMGWEATGYGFIKRQSQEHPNQWVKLGEPAPSGLIVAGH